MQTDTEQSEEMKDKMQLQIKDDSLFSRRAVDSHKSNTARPAHFTCTAVSYDNGRK